jgi:hypothetical protein
MKRIREIIGSFGHSTPIYSPQFGYDKHEISLVLTNPYKPKPPENASYVDTMTYEAYTERYDTKTLCYKVMSQDIERAVKQRALYAMSSFYKNYSGLRKPMMSGTYKWLRNLSPNNDSVVEGFISILRYLELHSKKVGQIAFSDDINNLHVRNAMCILAKMREKYDR